MTLRELLAERIRQAMTAAGLGPEFEPQVAPAGRPDFGDYQANCALAAARAIGTRPRALAEEIVARLDLDGIAARVEVAGPGFINIWLDNAFLGRAAEIQRHQLALPRRIHPNPETVVIDYSSPNLAKEMHVGHLRSTILGDAQARILEYLGHRVIRQNHMGDWGTQFGMLIAELEEHLGKGETPELALSDLERFYQRAKRHFDEDPAFAERARGYVVRLQSGDPHCRALWERFIAASIAHAEEIYRLLNVTLIPADIRPESAYNEELPEVVAELERLGLAVEDQGAKVVFLEELADREGRPSPVIIQKSDGGYLYATTDLAAVRYRVRELGAKRILYFIDARQSLHMRQVFLVARKAGFAPPEVSLEHHAFGTLLGPDGKPFKTRSGGTVKLAELLREAIQRAERLVAEKNPDLGPEERAEVARKVGIGAVKYADLSKTRTHDYRFDWDAMLSFEGNTAPYLQYAYTRIRSLFRRAGRDPGRESGPILPEVPEERQLALGVVRFEEVLEQVAREAFPHLLCHHLYALAGAFMTFYERCPILHEGVEETVRDSRLALADAVGATLAKGLELLGIEVMERM